MSFTRMRLASTSAVKPTVFQVPSTFLVTALVPHFPYHHPPCCTAAVVAAATTTITNIPPSTFPWAAATRPDVVVVVLSTEHSSVSNPVRSLCIGKCVACVSAVPGHRQPILTDLITDGERRVFSRIPQTVSTLDLHKATSCQRYSFRFISW